MKKEWTKERRKAQKKRKLWERPSPSKETVDNLSKARNVFLSKRTTIINSFKKDGCQICGEKDIRCLDYHHVSKENKVKSIAHMRSAPIDSLLAEIEKCIVLCANCHRKINHRN